MSPPVTPGRGGAASNHSFVYKTASPARNPAPSGRSPARKIAENILNGTSNITPPREAAGQPLAASIPPTGAPLDPQVERVTREVLSDLIHPPTNPVQDTGKAPTRDSATEDAPLTTAPSNLIHHSEADEEGEALEKTFYEDIKRQEELKEPSTPQVYSYTLNYFDDTKKTIEHETASQQRKILCFHLPALFLSGIIEGIARIALGVLATLSLAILKDPDWVVENLFRGGAETLIDTPLNVLRAFRMGMKDNWAWNREEFLFAQQDLPRTPHPTPIHTPPSSPGTRTLPGEKARTASFHTDNFPDTPV